MNRCDVCKYKDSCVCIPYGCECFAVDIVEWKKQIKIDTINMFVESMRKYWGGLRAMDEIERVAEQLKGEVYMNDFYYIIYLKGKPYYKLHTTEDCINKMKDMLKSGIPDEDIKVVTVIGKFRFNILIKKEED